jgi:hypothetical protein
MRSSRLIILLMLHALLPGGAVHGSTPAGLRVLESRHYRIHTDLEPAFAQELGQRLDVMYEEYSRRLVEFSIPENQPRFEVYLFNRQADYMQFTNNRFPNTAGVFMSGRNMLAAFLENQGRDALRRTLQHEAFHQFAFTAIGPDLPIWLNEGLAQLFEEGIWTGREFRIGQVPPRRVRQLQADVQNKRLVDFDVLLRQTPREWSRTLSRDADQGGTQYNQAWAMVHFLVFAGDSRGQPAYRQRLTEMLRLIHQGRGGEEAFKEAFGGNVAGFQARFTEWAGTLQPTPEATMIERQSVLADMLLALADQGQTFEDMERFRQTAITHRLRMKYTRGELQWESEENPAVYFANLEGRPFNRYQLYFEPRWNAPMPDLVCQVTEQVRLRTRFYYAGQKVEHEVVIETR